MNIYHWKAVFARPVGATAWSSGVHGSEPVWMDRNATVEQLLDATKNAASGETIDHFKLTTEVARYTYLTVRRMDVNGNDLPITRQVVNRRLKKSAKKHATLPDGTPFVWYEVPDGFKGVLE